MKFHLNISLPKIKYRLQFYHNVNIIYDNSGVGKSTMVRYIDKYLKEEGTVKVDCEFEIITPYSYHLKDIMTNTSKKVLVVDEGLYYSNKDVIIDCILNYELKLILVDRSIMQVELPLDVDAIYTFKSTNSKLGIVTRNIRKYSKEIYSKGSQNNHTIVEGSGSGFQFFSEIFNKVESSQGNSNVVKKLKNRSNVIVDSVGFGNYIGSLLSKKEVFDFNLLDVDSFEYLILRLTKYKKKQEELEELKFNWDFLKCNSLEDLYLRELKEYTGYSKKKLDSKFLSEDILCEAKKLLLKQPNSIFSLNKD